MRAGTLRHQITIQDQVVTQDPTTGAAIEKYKTKYEGVPAAIEPLNGREFLSAEQMRAEIRAKIMVRSGLDVLPTDRILFRNKVYEVQAVLDDPTFKRHQELMVSEGVRRDGDEA
jgi:SPP1 family predicted phage head-tail adaptor